MPETQDAKAHLPLSCHSPLGALPMQMCTSSLEPNEYTHNK